MHVCVLLGTWVHYSWWLPVLNAVPMAVLTAVAIPFPPLLLPLATCQLHQVLVIWANGKILIMQLPTVQVKLPAVTNWQDFGILLQGYLQPCCAELHCFARCKAISVIYTTTTTITTYVCVLGTGCGAKLNTPGRNGEMQLAKLGEIGYTWTQNFSKAAKCLSWWGATIHAFR